MWFSDLVVSHKCGDLDTQPLAAEQSITFKWSMHYYHR